MTFNDYLSLTTTQTCPTTTSTSSLDLQSGLLNVLSTMAINLDEEVRLWTTNSERESIENFSTLYGLIVSLEYLERAYVRDSVSSKESVRSFLNRDSATSRADCQVINLYRIRPDRPQLRTSMYKTPSAIQITPQTPSKPARPSLPST
jgi:hypothetical protein